MSVPLMRSYTTQTAAVALGVFGLAQDDITGLTFIQLNSGNNILDMYNDADPAASVFYTYELFKNSISTGRNFFSSAMSTSSAGRAAIGPIGVKPGQLQMGSTQTAGTAVASSNIVIKFSNGF